MNPLAIEARELHKTFTTRSGVFRRQVKTTRAVNGISFSIERGELFGLLGPNGAGKTTTVKMLTTLLLPTSGAISVLGFDAVRQTQQVRQRIGFTFGGARGLYGRLTGRDNLLYFAELYGLEPAVTRTRLPELLELVGLAGREKDRVETYSSGMQQRLHLARALLNDPQIVFLDEPTVGIDPVGARELRRTVKSLSERGKTVLLTTHYMAEAEELCDRIAIIKQGRIVALDTPASLKQRISGDALIDLQINPVCLGALAEQLQRLECCKSIQVGDLDHLKQVSIRTPEPEVVMQQLAPFLKPDFIQGLEVRKQTLEDVYVAIIQGEQA